MKRLIYSLSSVTLALIIGSCSLDDDGANFHYAPLEIVDAQVPDTFEFGNVYTINVDLLRPTIALWPTDLMYDAQRPIQPMCVRFRLLASY